MLLNAEFDLVAFAERFQSGQFLLPGLFGGQVAHPGRRAQHDAQQRHTGFLAGSEGHLTGVTGNAGNRQVVLRQRPGQPGQALPGIFRIDLVACAQRKLNRVKA